ncbi:hypothetical protein TNCV_4838481 [Trichonephila clavipes]|nr:hypothetical protein TNCV_4838481 [Trichonephila clavipes]
MSGRTAVGNLVVRALDSKPKDLATFLPFGKDTPTTSGRTSLKSDQRFGKPQTDRNAAVVQRNEHLIVKDRPLTVRETAVNKLRSVQVSEHAVLCDHKQSGCDICSQTSVSGQWRS